jgi:hypothetical protein
VPIIARNLHEILRQGLGDETFVGPHNYMPMPLMPDQANTTGWTMAAPRVRLGAGGLGTSPGGDYLIRGLPDMPGGAGAGAPGHDSMAIKVGAISLPATYFFRGAPKADSAVSPESFITGARRLAFHVAGDIGANPTLVFDVYGRTPRGVDIIETVTLQGLTNEKQPGWTAWGYDNALFPNIPAGNNHGNDLAARPIASAFYNPNGGTEIYVEIAGATNATPIVIDTTPTAHGLATDDVVTIGGVLGNTAANGVWAVTVSDGTHFSLKTIGPGIPVPGNGVYAASAHDWLVKGPLPNNFCLGRGGGGINNANWARLPVTQAFQTKNAWSRLYKMVIRERSGTNSDTILIPNYCTIDFGLRTRIDSINDIEEGSVLCFPYWTPFANLALPTIQQIASMLIYPLFNPVHKRMLRFEQEFNIVSFAGSDGTVSHPRAMKNPHVVSGSSSEFDLVGEMPPGFFDWVWVTSLCVAPGKVLFPR